MKTRPLSFEQATSRFVHRFTMDHVPNWALDQREDGTYYAPQFRSDREWYDNTKFKGEEGWIGTPRDTNCCTSNQTWPLGQSLPKPFTK